MFMYNWWTMKDSMNLTEMNILYMYNLCVITFIVILVITTSFFLIKNNFIEMNLFEKEWIEFVWTLFPGFILILLGIPSIELLYEMEMKNNPSLTIKILGNQWYWSYDYTSFKNIQFDSFMKSTEDMYMGEFRLLETDNSIIIPYNTTSLCLTTSNDVIHSWAIPSLNIKTDANPGRLNSFFLYSKYPGIFYGQCSEICGANHSFMPIKLEMCNSLLFKNWIMSF